MATENLVDQDDIGLADDTLTGDVRDYLLDRIRHLKKPWEKMNESEQRLEVEQADRLAGRLVKQTARVVAAAGRHAIAVEITDFKCKGGELKISVNSKSFDENLLFAANNRFAVLASADADRFEGEKQPGSAHVQPDQKSLLADDDDAVVDAPVMDHTPTGKAVAEEAEDPAKPENPQVEGGPVDSRLQSEYDAGYRAFERQEPASNNPHNKRTKKAGAWAEGWKAASNAKNHILLEVPSPDANGNWHVGGKWRVESRHETLDDVVAAFVAYCSENGLNSRQRAEVLAGNMAWYNKAKGYERLKEPLGTCVQEGKKFDLPHDDGEAFDEAEEVEEAEEEAAVDLDEEEADAI